MTVCDIEYNWKLHLSAEVFIKCGHNKRVCKIEILAEAKSTLELNKHRVLRSDCLRAKGRYRRCDFKASSVARWWEPWRGKAAFVLTESLKPAVSCSKTLICFITCLRKWKSWNSNPEYGNLEKKKNIMNILHFPNSNYLRSKLTEIRTSWT